MFWGNYYHTKLLPELFLMHPRKFRFVDSMIAVTLYISKFFVIFLSYKKAKKMFLKAQLHCLSILEILKYLQMLQ